MLRRRRRLGRNLASLLDFAPDDDVQRGLERLVVEGLESVSRRSPVACGWPWTDATTRSCRPPGGSTTTWRTTVRLPHPARGRIAVVVAGRSRTGSSNASTARAVIRSMAEDPEHRLGIAFDERLVELAGAVSPAMRMRGEQIKHSCSADRRPGGSPCGPTPRLACWRDRPSSALLTCALVVSAAGPGGRGDGAGRGR
jgi:hypothetical protein